MKLILPFAVTDGALLASNVPEDDGPAYSPLATYDLGDVTVDPVSHHVFESVQATNLGHALDDPAWWIDLGPTNRWAMFDQSNGSQTANTNVITASVQVNGRANGIAVLNVSARSVRVVASVPGHPRTNLLPWSAQFDHAAWIKTGTAVTADADYEPYGTLAADKVAEDSSTGTHLVTSGTINVGRNVSQVFSVYLKQAGTGTVRISVKAGGGNQINYEADLAAETGGASNGGGAVDAAGGIEPIGNGWLRIWISGVPDAGDVTAGVTCEIAVTRDGVSYTGDDASGVYAWGAQLETGTAPTHYIATGAAAVSSTAVIIYDQTRPMVSNAGIDDWYAYFFDEVVRLTDLVLTDLPPYANPRIDVSAIGIGDTVRVGNLIMGQQRFIGETERGLRIGIRDYSKKEADEFGNYTIVERAFSKSGQFPIYVDNNLVDALFVLFSQYRAKPILWIGADAFAATYQFGFFKEFALEIAYPTESIYTLEIEGLT